MNQLNYLIENIPAIVINFEALISIMWFLARDCVLVAFGLVTNGRIPLQADNTSPRRTLTSGLK